ncbi:MAG: O-methyltransferase [Clostridia bacterium]|nr:O-methyltransferase [Clostridia bacterium]
MNALKEIEDFALLNKIPILLPESRVVLQKLTKELKSNSNILEIGTAIGYSGCLMLLNSPKSNLTTIEKNSNMVKIAKNNFKKLNLCSRVNILQGDATEILKDLNKKYDFIFLDGSKSQYVHQLPFLINLMTDNAVIMADNVLFRGMVLAENPINKKYKTIINNLRKFIEEVKNNNNLKSEILNIGDGLMIIKKI